MLERQPVAVVDPVRLVVSFEEIHVPRHRLPLPVDDSPVAVPLPQAVGDDHPGVRPARARPVREHMAHVRHEAGVQAVGILPVGEVGQVLREERMRVGEVGGAVHEHLRVGRPAEALVALRTVRRHREVVRVEPPADVGDQAVHARVSRDEPSGLHLLRDGRDGSRTPVRERHGARRRHREVAEPEERMARHVGLRALPQRVADAGVRAAKRRQIGRERRAVIAARLLAVRLVEHLGRADVQHRPGRPRHREGRHGGAVLPEIDDQHLARRQRNGLTGRMAPHDLRAPPRRVAGPFHALRHIDLPRRQHEVVPQGDLRLGRTQLTREFVVAAHGPQTLDAPPRIVDLALVDAGGDDRPRVGRHPALVRTIRG